MKQTLQHKERGHGGGGKEDSTFVNGVSVGMEEARAGPAPSKASSDEKNKHRDVIEEVYDEFLAL